MAMSLINIFLRFEIRISKSETILKYEFPNYKNVLNFCFAFGEAIRIDSSASPPSFLSKAESAASVGMTKSIELYTFKNGTNPPVFLLFVF